MFPATANLPAASMRRLPRSAYLAVLGSLFALSGDSSQHSLWTWLTFVGGNATLAAWLWEQNGQRCNRAILVSAGNALMCLAIIGVIAWTRL
jgi:hypothetical protein